MAKCLEKLEVTKLERHLPTFNMQVCSATPFFMFIITQLPDLKANLSTSNKSWAKKVALGWPYRQIYRQTQTIDNIMDRIGRVCLATDYQRSLMKDLCHLFTRRHVFTLRVIGVLCLCIVHTTSYYRVVRNPAAAKQCHNHMSGSFHGKLIIEICTIINVLFII